MTSTTVSELNQEDFDREILQSDRPVLVDFWADWCQPCHVLAPTIDELAEEYGGQIKVAKLDVDANQEIASRLGISSIPTVILFRDGQIANKFVGVTPKQAFVEALEAVAML